MNIKTKDEVEEFILKTWPRERLTVEATKREQDWVVDITGEYEGPGLRYEQLMACAEFFGTKRIDVTTSHSTGGCDTCDYGAETTIKLHVMPE